MEAVNDVEGMEKIRDQMVGNEVIARMLGEVEKGKGNGGEGGGNCHSLLYFLHMKYYNCHKDVNYVLLQEVVGTLVIIICLSNCY